MNCVIFILISAVLIFLLKLAFDRIDDLLEENYLLITAFRKYREILEEVSMEEREVEKGKVEVSDMNVWDEKLDVQKQTVWPVLEKALEKSKK